MYFVNSEPYEDFFDALDICKGIPYSKLTNEDGVVIMEHQEVPEIDAIEVSIASKVLKCQEIQ